MVLGRQNAPSGTHGVVIQSTPVNLKTQGPCSDGRSVGAKVGTVISIPLVFAAAAAAAVFFQAIGFAQPSMVTVVAGVVTGACKSS